MFRHCETVENQGEGDTMPDGRRRTPAVPLRRVAPACVVGLLLGGLLGGPLIPPEPPARGKPPNRIQAAAAPVAHVRAGSGIDGWQRVAVTGLQANSSLSDVVALGPNSVWIVGQQNVWDSWQNRAVLSRWDGTAWSEATVRGDTIGADHLRSIAAASPTELWTAGVAHDGGPYLARGDGNVFDRVNAPVLTATDWLGAVAAVPGRMVAVGSRGDKTLIVSADGGSWKIADRPHEGTLYGVTLTGRDSGWTVGDSGDRPLIMRLSGKTWRTQRVPLVRNGFLRDVYAESAKRAWAVGGVYQGNGRYRPLVMKWNGKTWSTVKTPASGAELYGVTGDGKGRLWISGYDPARPSQSFLLRLDGKRWSTQYGKPMAGSTAVRLQALARVPKTDVLWTVGHVVDRMGRYGELAERSIRKRPSA
ncbi:hypothetical protein [Rhizohabitans arisaemae]|uniref:hypothetical protein n=1 Tax=Rhizohabitans arisaemae TaxID=2720610 RepID=UPI0024B1E29D|nr:hypothetical protein [Rhizohabitans arisaemae]